MKRRTEKKRAARRGRARRLAYVFMAGWHERWGCQARGMRLTKEDPCWQNDDWRAMRFRDWLDGSTPPIVVHEVKPRVWLFTEDRETAEPGVD